jgi:hypothetical protein
MNTSKLSSSEKVYRLLLNLYPLKYQKDFGLQMQQVFRDMLEENAAPFVWTIVLQEIPVSLFNEYKDALRGGEVRMKANILPIGIGIICIIGLMLIFDNLLHAALYPSIPLFQELNGPMSLMAWTVYLLSGIIVGLIARKSHVLVSIVSGLIAWFIFALANLSDWQFYIGLAKNHMPFQIGSYFYFIELGVVVILLLGIGGHIGKILQSNLFPSKVKWKARA